MPSGLDDDIGTLGEERVEVGEDAHVALARGIADERTHDLDAVGVVRANETDDATADRAQADEGDAERRHAQASAGRSVPRVHRAVEVDPDDARMAEDRHEERHERDARRDEHPDETPHRVMSATAIARTARSAIESL